MFTEHLVITGLLGRNEHVLKRLMSLTLAAWTVKSTTGTWKETGNLTDCPAGRSRAQATMLGTTP